MKIALFGCGWLGKSLAKRLQPLHTISATTRSVHPPNSLSRLGISHTCLTLGDDLTNPALHSVFASEVAIINIAAGRRSTNFDVYSQHMEDLIKHCKQVGVNKVLFVSTTSVYGSVTGTVTEQTTAAPLTASGKAHVEIEQCLLDTYGEDASVLRLAGLAGTDRHPINTLSGKTELKNPNTPVNLIHKEDVIEAICALLSMDKWGKTLLLCATNHPNRIDYYQRAARQKSLPEPQFVTGNDSVGKKIDASATLAYLGITLKYPSPYDML